MELQPNPVDLMMELITLSEDRMPTVARFDAMATRWVGEAATPRALFLQGCKNALREMPVQVFPNMDQREMVLAAVQFALDNATLEELPP